MLISFSTLQYSTSLAAFLHDTSISSADFTSSPRPSVDLRDLVEEYNVDKLRSAMLLLKVKQDGGDEEAILKLEINDEDLPKKVSELTHLDLTSPTLELTSVSCRSSKPSETSTWLTS